MLQHRASIAQCAYQLISRHVAFIKTSAGKRVCVSVFATHVYPGTKSTLVSHAVSLMGGIECYIKDD